MKILVYGAGNIGSLYAAKLKDAGHDVTILARGARLHDIRAHGIVLQECVTGRESTTQINAVEQLAAEDAYDLVLVILPRCSVSIRWVPQCLGQQSSTRLLRLISP